MRKFLVLLLTMMLLVSNSILVAADSDVNLESVEQQQSLNNETIELEASNNLTTPSSITYKWDLNAALIKEQQSKSETTLTLKLETERYLESRNETVTSSAITVSKENEDVWLKTDLLEAIKGKGETNLDEEIDDWMITEDMLGEDNTYEKEIKIYLNNNKDLMDLIINVSIIGDNDITLCKETVTVTIENKALWFFNGLWLSSDMDEFCLGRRAKPISFWLQEALPNLNVQIKQVINEDLGETVYTLDENDLRTGIRGKRSKSGRENLTGEYYSIKLKAMNMPILECGKSYALVIMNGDDVLSFDGDNTAILTFTVTDDGLLMRRNLKLELQRCGEDKIPKYDKSKIIK